MYAYVFGSTQSVDVCATVHEFQAPKDTHALMPAVGHTGNLPPPSKEEMIPSPEDPEAGTKESCGPGLSLRGTHTGKDLVWSKVNLKLLEKKGGEKVKKHILQNVWGRAQAGTTTAIMGASGAGSKFEIFVAVAIKKIRSKLDVTLSHVTFRYAFQKKLPYFKSLLADFRVRVCCSRKAAYILEA